MGKSRKSKTLEAGALIGLTPAYVMMKTKEKPVQAENRMIRRAKKKVWK